MSDLVESYQFAFMIALTQQRTTSTISTLRPAVILYSPIQSDRSDRGEVTLTLNVLLVHGLEVVRLGLELSGRYTEFDQLVKNLGEAIKSGRMDVQYFVLPPRTKQTSTYSLKNRS